MAFNYSPKIATDGLVLYLDAANTRSYVSGSTTWTDLGRNGNNVTLVNSPTYTSTSYFTFNGTTQYATGTTTNVVPSTTYSKQIWFYLNAIADNNLISSDVGGHYMFFGSTNRLYAGNYNWAGFPYNLQSTTTFTTGIWYNAAITFNTTDGMILYVNGVLNATYTAVKTAHNGNGATNIASYGTGNLLNGRISSAMIYNRTITATEVRQNYNATKTRFGL
jgi:hypothetical protein